jgi:hypothetical protein
MIRRGKAKPKPKPKMKTMNQTQKSIIASTFALLLSVTSLLSADLDLDALKKKLPETITPLTETQLATNVPQSYYFDYRGSPQPGKRIWTRIDTNTWYEVYPDGFTSIFKVLGHTTVMDTEGTIVVKVSGDFDKTSTTTDGGFQAFIPDKGSKLMHFWYRNNSRGDANWNDLAEMKDVK